MVSANSEVYDMRAVVPSDCLHSLQLFVPGQPLSKTRLLKLTRPTVELLKDLLKDEITKRKLIIQLETKLHRQGRGMLSLERSELNEQLEDLTVDLKEILKQKTKAQTHITSLANLSLESSGIDHTGIRKKIHDLALMQSTSVPQLIDSIAHIMAQIKFRHTTALDADELLGTIEQTMQILAVLNKNLVSFFGEQKVVEMVGDLSYIMMKYNSSFMSNFINDMRSFVMTESYFTHVYEGLGRLLQVMPREVELKKEQIILEYFCKNVPDNLLPFCETSFVIPIIKRVQ